MRRWTELFLSLANILRTPFLRAVFEMCQLWVNLPAKDKMTPPKYQEILKKDIDNAVSPLYEYSKDAEGCGAKADLEEGCVRVIGENI